MKILSLNMRGWGGSAKRRRLCSLIQKEKFDVCFLQETKKASIESYMIRSLWGHDDFSWVAKDLVGLSGGLLIIWNSDFCNLFASFSGDGYLGVRVEKEGVEVYFVNVYSPCNLSGKKKLWENMLSLKQQGGGGNGVWEVTLIQSFMLRKEKVVAQIVD
jgi:exonuclease III